MGSVAPASFGWTVRLRRGQGAIGCSVRERVGREDRVVEDHGLGFASEEADLQFTTELIGVCARLAVTESVEPATSLVTMSEAVMSHRQEGPDLRKAFSVPELNPFLQTSNRLFKPISA